MMQINTIKAFSAHMDVYKNVDIKIIIVKILVRLNFKRPITTPLNIYLICDV